MNLLFLTALATIFFTSFTIIFGETNTTIATNVTDAAIATKVTNATITTNFTDATIATNVEQINCDGIKCPANSTSCAVSKETFGNLSMFNYTRTCFDANGIPTTIVTKLIPNPYPGTEIEIISAFDDFEEQNKPNNTAFDLFDIVQANFPPGFPFN